jgi:hypothetical protein
MHGLARWPLALLVAIAAAACSHRDPVQPYRELQSQTASDLNRIYQAVPVQSADAYQVLVQSGGIRVELLHSPGGAWRPGGGATNETVSVMMGAEARLLPLLAYRRFTVDAKDPAFGLSKSTVTYTVQNQTAHSWNVHIGGPTPTGAGYYVQVDGDPHVYAVVPSIIYDLRSLLAGTRIKAPVDPSVQAVLNSETKTQDPEEVTNPWLAQVLQVEGESPTPAP